MSTPSTPSTPRTPLTPVEMLDDITAYSHTSAEGIYHALDDVVRTRRDLQAAQEKPMESDAVTHAHDAALATLASYAAAKANAENVVRELVHQLEVRKVPHHRIAEAANVTRATIVRWNRQWPEWSAKHRPMTWEQMNSEWGEPADDNV